MLEWVPSTSTQELKAEGLGKVCLLLMLAFGLITHGWELLFGVADSHVTIRCVCVFASVWKGVAIVCQAPLQTRCFDCRLLACALGITSSAQHYLPSPPSFYSW